MGGEARPLPEEQLPIQLPETDQFKPSGHGDEPQSPLAAIRSWVETTDPASGKPARRETNTMPQWAGSCWYYLRFLDPHNDRALVDPAAERYWMPVDLYIGGGEHAVLHLLYARFWHKVLFDIGVVSTPEPFMKLIHQGTILGEDMQKMSKSRGNVVNPDDLSRATAPTRCGSTRCSWARSKPRSRGARRASRACRASSTGCGA